MDEALITQVIVSKKDGEKELEIRLEDDICISFRLDGKILFSGDYTNFAEVFKRALKIWEEK